MSEQNEGAFEALLQGQPLPLSVLVGRQIRKYREEAGRSQDELADAARRAGLDWTRGAVASLETGRRGLAADEFVLLPMALKILTGRDQWRLRDLLPDAWVRSPSGVALGGGSLRDLLAGETVEAWGAATGDAHKMRQTARALAQQGEAVRHAARRLGVEPATVSRAADELWGRPFNDERDARVFGAREGEEMSPRRIQALRGHVTRELINELRPALDQEGSNGN